MSTLAPGVPPIPMQIGKLLFPKITPLPSPDGVRIPITMLLADVGGCMISTMGRDRTQPATPDLFSTTPVGETTSPTTGQVSPAQAQRHVLPKDLPNAVKHLTDRELDLLIAATVEEAKRRGRVPPSLQANPTDETETVIIEGQAASSSRDGLVDPWAGQCRPCGT